MLSVKSYEPSMQADMERAFAAYMAVLGIPFDPHAQHTDIANIPEVYLSGGGMWGLYDGDTLLGMVAIKPLDPERKTAEMKRLFVLSPYHGQGYGEVLFVHALNFARESGFTCIRLDTRQDRTAARHLFVKYGFVPIGRYNDNKHAELFFELDLESYTPAPFTIFFPQRIPAFSDFVIIVARYEGHWVFVRNKDRDTYELPGGHVEPGEDLLSAARRELYEETGAVEYSITPLLPYGIARRDAVSAGMLYYADIERFVKLPDFEIAERLVTDTIPEKLTYPAIQPKLWMKVREWLSENKSL